MTARRREGASLSRADLGAQYRAWLRHHRLSAADSLFRVIENPVSSVLTWLVIGVALALPTGFSVALDNLTQLVSRWDSPAQITVFLQDGVPRERGEQLQQELALRTDVAQTQFVSREEALAKFSELSGFADVLASLEENPLPDSILVSPGKGLPADSVSKLRGELVENTEVAEAVLDMAWLQRLNQLMALGRKVVWAVGGTLLLGVLLILGNTIRLAIENRREEIVVVKLVGGSNAFVRRPFLYTGLWYGVGGGAVAAAMVSIAFWSLQASVANLAELYNGVFLLEGLGIMGALNLIIVGSLLGLAGAWLAVGRHLARIEPG